MAIAYLMLGSNLGDRLKNLQQAFKALGKEVGVIIRSSAIYESEPWGFSHPEYFLNQILILQTSFEVEEVLGSILKIEEGMGRVRNSHDYQARTIDIDILFYNEQVVQSEFLTVPHPRMTERRFVLLPLLEMESDLIHPVTGRTIWEMYRECQDTLSVKVLY